MIFCFIFAEKTYSYRYTLPKFLAHTARSFNKFYKPDYQSLLEYVMYGRFANAPKNKSLTYNYIHLTINPVIYEIIIYHFPMFMQL
ncbi:hypothetical protein CGC59_07375 [Capnocytophaga sputigena]|uniref:Uncharacterized protein n=1 Tax=Capnocytophaga sputigena TaxID=1019 RepID=A0A250F2Y2_CAPSP|nr:hypothetical protein CGC59_07375 [Capnocytophaga sputigena]